MGTKIRIKKTNEPKNHRDIEQVKTVYTDGECSAMLVDGWILLHAGATHIDGLGYNAKTTFILGKHKA